MQIVMTVNKRRVTSKQLLGIKLIVEHAMIAFTSAPSKIFKTVIVKITTTNNN